MHSTENQYCRAADAAEAKNHPCGPRSSGHQHPLFVAARADRHGCGRRRWREGATGRRSRRHWRRVWRSVRGHVRCAHRRALRLRRSSTAGADQSRAPKGHQECASRGGVHGPSVCDRTGGPLAFAALPLLGSGCTRNSPTEPEPSLTSNRSAQTVARPSPGRCSRCPAQGHPPRRGQALRRDTAPNGGRRAGARSPTAQVGELQCGGLHGRHATAA